MRLQSASETSLNSGERKRSGKEKPTRATHRLWRPIRNCLRAKRMEKRTEKRGLESLRAHKKMTGPALLPSFSGVSRGFEDHVSEPANAQLDAASWDGRGGCEADGVGAGAPLAPTPPPACAGTPPRAGGEYPGSPLSGN